MKLITRYVVREHIGPLVFALTALTSLLMLQYVARQLANLAGKGLPWSVIWQFFYLSLPFTIAMTMPMAVLVATLYAFGRMAAEHEITALKASGVRVRSLVLPVFGCALLLSFGMVAFNDQVMPRANHKLRILQQDIARTKPTLALRDQTLNAITDQFYMRVGRSSAQTNKMWDVSIYDLTGGPERKTIYADSGVFSLAPNGQDLQIELFDGYAQEFVRGDTRRLQRSYFRTQMVRKRGISRGFESSRSDNYKGDREMTICEMQRKYAVNAMDFERIRQEYIGFISRTVTKGTKTISVPGPRPPKDALASFYCGAVASLFSVKTAHAQGPPPVPAVDPNARMPQPLLPMNVDSVAMFKGAAMAATTQLAESRESLDSLSVEIQKKFALSFACVIFVLFGPPIALRFPRGGVGVTIGVSIIVFGLYYICLMGGEALADKGRLPAIVAMWIANVIFGVVGVLLLWRVESTTDTSRGGGLRDWWADRKARAALRAEEAAERGAERGAERDAAKVPA